MANAYTSIATTPGLVTELVQAAYDKAVGEELRTWPTMRNFVQMVPGNPAMRGTSTTMEKFAWFDSTAVTAAKTPLSEEVDVDSVKMPKPNPITVTPQEYGFVVTHTRKLAARTFAPFEPFKAKAIAAHMNDVLDSLIQDVMVAGTQVAWANDATSNASLNAGDYLKAHDLRIAVANLRAQNVPTFYGGYYALVSHPFAILDLREESGSGGWRQPTEYGTDQSKIWTGEIAEFEGVRVVQSPTVRWVKDGSGSGGTQFRSMQNYIFGSNALVEQVFTEPGVRVAPQLDKLGRFFTLGWYGDLGWAIYEQKAIYRLVSTSTNYQALV